MTRPRLGGPQGPDDKDDGRNEPAEDAVVAQVTTAEAHSPQPRAAVTDEEPSVVVADEESLHPPRPKRRGSADKTLIIRDRRVVEEMRAQLAIDRARAERKKMLKGLALWGVAALAAFGIGGALAVLASGGGQSAESDATHADADAQPPHAPQATAQEPEPVLDLDEVERSRRSPDESEIAPGAGPKEPSSAPQPLP